MNIAVIGSREFPQLLLVADYVKGLSPETVIISGGARGVDRTAAATARATGHPVREILPNWDRDGKSAGFKRNAEIVAASDRLVAFWDGKSRGTADTIEKARQADLTITVINPDGTRYEPEPIDPDSFDDTDPQDGATREEYEDTQARDEAADYALPKSDHEGNPKVKLLTTSLRWICAAKSKTRETKNGRTLDYFTQALFTTRGNRVILTYDAGTHPMKEGAGRGIVVEIFGREIEKHTNGDKTQTAVVFGAEVITRREAEQKKPANAPSKSRTPEKPKPSEADQARTRHLAKLRMEYDRLARELEYDDRDENIRRGQLEELGMRIYYTERGLTPVPADSAPEAVELRTLINEQNSDRFGCAGDEIDKNADDADENTAADILDADNDGAEVTRATEPWADSSAPLGSTVDEDCWTCPCRAGASCTRVLEGCILA
jgi:hypothetical protein